MTEKRADEKAFMLINGALVEFRVFDLKVELKQPARLPLSRDVIQATATFRLDRIDPALELAKRN